MSAVLFMESSKNIGGQELQLLQQMRSLNAKGWSTRLICKQNSRILDVAKENGLDVVCAPLRNALHFPSICLVRAQLQSMAPKALIVHSGHDAIIGALAARSLGKKRPKIIRMRTYYTSKPGAFPYNHLFDHAFACSAYLRDQILSGGKINPSRVSVLYPGIDFAKLEISTDHGDIPEEIAVWLNSHPGPVMLHGAMLRSEKGHLSILNAMQSVLEKHPDLRYVIAGEGGLRKVLEEKVAALGLHDNVLFAGMINPIGPILRRSDMAILPSLAEPFGMFQIEAINLGIPVIASRVGGIPETMRDRIDGLLVEPGNSQAWADAIIWALDNLAVMREWALVGRAENRVRFSVENNTDRLISFIESARDA